MQNFKPEIKLLLVVAAVSAALAVAGILLLQAVLRPSSHMPAPSPQQPKGDQVREGITQLYGEAIHKNDVQTIPDSKLSGKIWLFSDAGFANLLETDALRPSSFAGFPRLQNTFDEKEVEKYASAAAIIEDGEFSMSVPHGVFVVCYENLVGVQEGRVSILGCNRGELETVKMDVVVISSFGAITISGGGGEWEREWMLPSVEEIDTSTWQTYRNDEFEFKYPNDYSIEPDSSTEKAEEFNEFRIIDASGSFSFRIRVEEEIPGYVWRGINARCPFDIEQEVFQECDYLKSKGEPVATTRDNVPVYFLTDGDVGSFVRNYAIPDYEDNRWIIFGTGGDFNDIEMQGLQDERQEFQQAYQRIPETFRFLEPRTSGKNHLVEPQVIPLQISGMVNNKPFSSRIEVAFPLDLNEETIKTHIADLDKDGNSEVIITSLAKQRYSYRVSRNGYIFAVRVVNASGETEELGKLTHIASFATHTPLLEVRGTQDLTNDGKEEIIISYVDESIESQVEGIIGVNFTDQKLEWMQLQGKEEEIENVRVDESNIFERQQGVENALFRIQDGGSGADWWAIEDVNEDGKKEFVDFSVGFAARPGERRAISCDVGVYQWDGARFVYDDEFSESRRQQAMISNDCDFEETFPHETYPGSRELFRG